LQPSYWEKKAAATPSEFLIIGGGIVGLSAGVFLRKAFPNSRIQLVEKGTPAAGATTRNAGFACFGMPGEILDDYAAIGPEKSIALIEQRYKGLNLLRSIHGDTAIDYREVGGWEVFFDSDKDAYQKVLDFLPQLHSDIKNASSFPADFKFNTNVSPKKTFSKVNSSFIFNPLEGLVDSGKLFLSLQNACREANVIIWQGISLTHFEESSDSVEFTSESGLTFSAKNVLVCVNGFTSQLFPALQDEIKPARGQILLFCNNENLSIPEGAFHYDRGYTYFRTLPSGELLLGGARNHSFESELTFDQNTGGSVREALIKFALDNLGKTQIVGEWAGTMGIGANRSPIFRKISPRIQVIGKLGGMGIALGTGLAFDAVQSYKNIV